MLHPYTHYYLGEKFIEEFELNKRDKEIFLLGNIIPDFYLFSINKIFFFLNVKYSFKSKNPHHSLKIVKEKIKNNNKDEEYFLYLGMYSHLLTDIIAHNLLIHKEKGKFHSDFEKNHFYLERYIDLSLNNKYDKYKLINKLLNFKNVNIFFKSDISRNNHLSNWGNFLLWKGYLLFKIKIEDNKYKSGKIDIAYYLGLAESIIKRKITKELHKHE